MNGTSELKIVISDDSLARILSQADGTWKYKAPMLSI